MPVSLGCSFRKASLNGPFVCRLAIDSLDLAGRLCSAVFKGDVVLLQRLLKAGAPPDTADYDGRTALHVAAAEGHMGAVCPDI